MNYPWQATVQDEQGNAVLNPVVTVWEADGVTLATIYDVTGAVIPNPITGSLEGFVQFWTSAGSYIIEGAKAGEETEPWHVIIGGVDSDSILVGTAASVATTEIRATTNLITTSGYDAVGDGGAASYKRVASEPVHDGKVQSADGAWWELVNYLAPVGRVNVDFVQNGRVIALGGNSRESTFTRGLQIGGGKKKDGPHGVQFAAEGHANWTGLFNSRNYSTIELAVHPTVATMEVSFASGSNTITRLYGSNTDPWWVGKRIYVGDQRILKVTAVSGNIITLSNLNGSAFSWPSTGTEVARVCMVIGSGTGTISGNKLLRTEGDPFILYYQDPSFEMKINGTVRTVTGWNSIDEYVLSAAIGDGVVSYEFTCTIDDCYSMFRLHGTDQDVENITMAFRHDGGLIEMQFGDYGKARPLRLTTGRRSDGTRNNQVVLQKNGDLSLGGDYDKEAIRILSSSGYTPANRLETSAAATGFSAGWRARGSDANVGMTFDAKGTPLRAFDFSNNSYGKSLFFIKNNTLGSMLLPQYNDDTAAGAGGIAIGEWYQNLTIGAIRQRRS